MKEVTKKCGPDSTDNYTYWDARDTSFSHTIKGVGKVTVCQVVNRSRNSKYDESYTIEDGITELGDGSMNYSSITSIRLPKTLKIIGCNCFANTRISSISLPDSLETIGESNFPSSLTQITIPPLITFFPLSNIRACKNMKSVGVHEENTHYKAIDGVLYNYDLTEILFCPSGKSGTFNIPSTVIKIGDSCFESCDKLTKITIPSSVETIGNYAFSGVKLEKLIIPDSVKSVGEGCFNNTEITTKFHLSDKIINIPESCFEAAKIPIEKYLNRWETIGKDALRSVDNFSSGTISLLSAKRIGNAAFASNKGISTIELFSFLEYIDMCAFSGLNHPKIKIYSFTPIRVHPDVFSGMQIKYATLMVPRNTKFIFENVEPWSGFYQILEMDLDKDVDGDEVYEASTQDYLARLKSVDYSLNNPNRLYLKEIIERLFEEYKYVETDEEFEEALCLINYNRTFRPAIIPNLEQQICQKWDDKYKLKLLDKFMMEGILDMQSLIPGANLFSNKERPSIALPINIDKDFVNYSEAIEDRNITVHFSNILTNIQNELSKAEKVVKIAVSWFTNYALFAQTKEMAVRGIRIQLITNNDAINNGGYCLDLNQLIDAGVEISLVEYPHLLHHKFCIIDDSVVINGSYNWTRFSQNNYENIIIFRYDDAIVEAFDKEFCLIWANAEHQSIKRMPDTVPQRLEYDRYAFRQYITEELDAQARETSDEREKITALYRAKKLNEDYLKIINPDAVSENQEAFTALEQSEGMAQDVLAIITDHEGQVGQVTSTPTLKTKGKTSDPAAGSSTVQPGSNKVNVPKATGQTKSAGVPFSSKEELSSLQEIKASSLYMVLDVSGSMDDTYKSGHVHNIALKALSAALALAKTKEVSLWTFGNDSQFHGNVGLNNISVIKSIGCKGEGTKLINFVNKASASMEDGSFVIIFTDDDGSSIKNALDGMKNKSKVFWQLIVYGKDHSNISNAIAGVNNASVVCLNDYASKSDKEINEILLKDYVVWKGDKR